MAVRKMTDDGINMYPLDISALEKGDFIPPEMIEEFSGLKRIDPRYSLACQNLKDLVRKGLHRIGRIWTLDCHKGGIRMLKDTDAALYNKRRWDKECQAQGRTLRDNLHVDPSRIEDDGARRQHESNCNSMSRQYAAMKRERRRVLLAPHKRATPGLAPVKPTNAQ